MIRCEQRCNANLARPRVGYSLGCAMTGTADWRWSDAVGNTLIMALWIEGQECACDPAGQADRGVVSYQGATFCKWCRRRVTAGSARTASNLGGLNKWTRTRFAYSSASAKGSGAPQPPPPPPGRVYLTMREGLTEDLESEQFFGKFTNWYGSSYRCRTCPSHLYKTVFPEGHEFEIETDDPNNARIAIKRVFSCARCWRFVTTAVSEDEIGVVGGGYLGEPNNFEYQCKSMAEYEELIRAMDAIGSTVGRSDAGFIRLVGVGREGGSLGVGGRNAVDGGSDQWQAAYREMQSLVDALSDAVESEDDSRLDSAFGAASAEARMMFWSNAVTVTMGLKQDSPEAIREQVSHLMNGGQATLKELLADIESMSVEGQAHALFLLTHHPVAEVRQIGAVIGEVVDSSGASSPTTKAEAQPSRTAEQRNQSNNLIGQENGTTHDPGYYLDPDDPARERWWDGRKWVGLTRPAKPGATTPAVREMRPAGQASVSPSAAVPASRKPATPGRPHANNRGGVSKEGSKSDQEPDDSSVEHTGRADPHVPGNAASPQAGRRVMSGPMGRSSRRRWVAIGVLVPLLVALGVITVRRDMALNDLKDVYQEYSTFSGEESGYKLCAKPVGGEFDFASVSTAPCFSPPGSRAVNDNRTRLVLTDGTGVITWEVKGDRFFRTSDGKAFVVHSRDGEKYLKPM